MQNAAAATKKPQRRVLNSPQSPHEIGEYEWQRQPEPLRSVRQQRYTNHSGYQKNQPVEHCRILTCRFHILSVRLLFAISPCKIKKDFAKSRPAFCIFDDFLCQPHPRNNPNPVFSYFCEQRTANYKIHAQSPLSISTYAQRLFASGQCLQFFTQLAARTPHGCPPLAPH